MDSDNAIRLFLAGDVMTGRGIDQVLPSPSHPRIYEPYVHNANDYVALAERTNGPIPKGVDYSYIWGDGLAALQEMAPDLRIINLETAVTRSDDYWRGKGINYRMHPNNVLTITAAGIDCCVLANNHTLDWGHAGLAETLQSLHKAGITTVGAGNELAEAAVPAVMKVTGGGRVLLFAFGHASSGVTDDWAATKKRAGVNLLGKLSAKEVRRIAEEVAVHKGERDIVVLSLHWGGNWGYRVSREQREFAHRLIDEAGVDLVYGHSSHHPRGIEVYREKLILYGCGDLLNDYEGISGYESYRDDLSLMYFPSLDPASGRLQSLTMVPQQIRHFRLNRASDGDARWLQSTLDRQSSKFDTRVALGEGSRLLVSW
jgi:poly-gamma-glutamate synthesis protein (capsule biosynthesis protein)